MGVVKMRIRSFIFISVVFLLLAGIATAEIAPIPDRISLTTSEDWLIATGGDQAVLTAHLYNATDESALFPDYSITYYVYDSTLGSVNPRSAFTGSDSNAITVFTATTKSGTAKIDAYLETNSLVLDTTYQRIDHDFPYRFDSPAYPDYDSEVVSNGSTTISVKMLDKWGNTIENRREVDEGGIGEQVSFSAESSPSSGINYGATAQFWNGTEYEPLVIFSVNSTGIAEAVLKVDAKPGINYILISPLVSTIADKYIQITGTATGVPAHIFGTVKPSAEVNKNPWVYTGNDPNDESRKFTITYFVSDQFGNGLQLKDIAVTILAEDQKEELVITTNATGYASFNYGPRSLVIKDIAVNAVPAENRDISANPIVLDFISADPVGIVVVASPQGMASRDANPAVTSKVRAKVINAAGDGVAGQTVSFGIENVRYPTGETYTITLSPSIDDPAENITDSDGYAQVTFRPGAFTTSWNDAHHDSTATAMCDINATWINPQGKEISAKVPVSWKNYPYLNAYTSLDRESVNVSDTVNLTIKLVGDGYKMDKKPIDVIICHDRSGSMQTDFPDRMVSAMAAATQFITNTEDGKDRTGLVSFGGRGTSDISDSTLVGIDESQICVEVPIWECEDVWVKRPRPGHWETQCGWVYHSECTPVNDEAAYIISHYPGNGKIYSDYATVDTVPSLGSEKDITISAINNLVPEGFTSMRYALYKSIKEYNNYPARDSVKAIIVVTDGDYNYYGDPLARGTGYTTAQKSVTDYQEKTQDYTKFGDISVANQNLSKFAIDNNIKIFSIAYSSDISTWTKDTLTLMSESTGGKHYNAPTGTDLEGIYVLISGQLREEAGVDTEMYSDFGTIEVNTGIYSGDDVLDYIGSEPTSTSTTKFSSKTQTTENGWIDQSNDWDNANQKLHFTIGTMYLNDIWEGRMTFRVNMTGNIKLFNSSVPAIFFMTPEGYQNINLPDTYLYASEEKVTGPDYGTFTESDFTVVKIENTIFEWTWNRDYTGTLPLKEQYFVSVDGGKSWVQVHEKTLTAEKARNEKIGKFRYDIRNLISPGQAVIVDFRVTGRAIDAPSPRKIGTSATLNQSGIHIQLE